MPRSGRDRSASAEERKSRTSRGPSRVAGAHVQGRQNSASTGTITRNRDYRPSSTSSALPCRKWTGPTLSGNARVASCRWGGSGSTGQPSSATSAQTLGWFVNDDVQVTAASLNLGLRYELDVPRTGRHDA
jgi:hypothetical protein